MSVKVNVTLETVFHRILKSVPGEFVIGGYAYPELKGEDGSVIPDNGNDTFDLDALDESFVRMMSKESRRNFNADHSNVQIGEILPEYTDSDGLMWKSMVVKSPQPQYPRRGLFIVSRLFNDIAEGKKYIGLMKSGHKLSFSISGDALMRKTVCNDETCFNKVMAMDLFEISSCDKGVNPEARAFFMKSSEQPVAATLISLSSGGGSLLSLLESDCNGKMNE